MSNHEAFIFSPITTVLEEAVSASYVINDGVETYPLSEYIIHSLFLKMTGFQEQKMKCIAWEMATYDYGYRRSLLQNEDKLGEYSSYKAKSAIYKRLNELIKSLKASYDVNHLTKQQWIDESVEEIKKIFSNSVLVTWTQRKYDYFVHGFKIGEEQILPSDTKMFKNKAQLSASVEVVLELQYEELYNNRNRLAHNTLSYQENLPSLKSLQKEDDTSRNYFIWFFILVLIDRIFMEIFKVYVNELEENDF